MKIIISKIEIGSGLENCHIYDDKGEEILNINKLVLTLGENIVPTFEITFFNIGDNK